MHNGLLVRSFDLQKAGASGSLRSEARRFRLNFADYYQRSRDDFLPIVREAESSENCGMKRVGWLVLLLVLPAFAKDRPTITIRVLGSSAWNRPHTIILPGSPGTPSQSSTNCNTDATAQDYGSMTSINGRTNCTTTTTPGEAPTPPTAITREIPQVELHALMPDESQVVLWCQVRLRNCQNLLAGKYAAEVEKDSVWVYVTSYAESPKYGADGKQLPRKTKADRIKYRIVSSTPAPPIEVQAYHLGRAEGYPDEEIAEAIHAYGAAATLKYLRDHQGEKK